MTTSSLILSNFGGTIFWFFFLAEFIFICTYKLQPKHSNVYMILFLFIFFFLYHHYHPFHLKLLYFYNGLYLSHSCVICCKAYVCVFMFVELAPAFIQILIQFKCIFDFYLHNSLYF